MKETIPEEGLEHFDEYLQNYSKNENHPLKILLGFYKGKKLQCAKGFFWLICQRSPVWVTPIVTANIIDIATNPGKNSIQRILFNLVIALLFISQNAFSNYMATKHFSGANREIEGSLRNALVRELQQLSIMFYKEIQSGRLQSKVMRDVENVQALLNQMVRTLFFFILDVIIASAVTLYHSPLVFVVFLAAIPVAVAGIYYFKKPISERNRAFRTEMESTQGAVAEMLEMIPVTRAHGLQEVEINKMQALPQGHHASGLSARSDEQPFRRCQLGRFPELPDPLPGLHRLSGCQGKDRRRRGGSVPDLFHSDRRTDLHSHQYLPGSLQGNGVRPFHRRYSRRKAGGAQPFHRPFGRSQGETSVSATWISSIRTGSDIF